MAKTLCTVLPTSQVQLKHVASKPDTDYLRHVEALLLSVWQRVQPSDQDRIAAYWKRIESETYPSLVLEDPWYGGPGILASTCIAGQSIRCDWPTFRWMPSLTITPVLAHELAHVFQHAVRINSSTITSNDLEGTIVKVDAVTMGPTGLIELHADETMQRWGFDPLASKTWLVQNTKELLDGTIIRRPQPLTEGRARGRAKQLRLQEYLSKLHGVDRGER
jgi:hypothetical protein